MKPNVVVIRAITVEFAWQFIKPFMWIALGIIIGLLCIVGVLAFTISQWWWLLAIPIIILGLIGTTVWIIVRLIARRISPRLNTEQKTAVGQFINKLRFVVETARTPYPFIILIVIKDIVTRSENGLIQTMITQSKTLRPDYEDLKKLF